MTTQSKPCRRSQKPAKATAAFLADVNVKHKRRFVSNKGFTMFIHTGIATFDLVNGVKTEGTAVSVSTSKDSLANRLSSLSLPQAQALVL
jgi:hypothetical protein